MVLLTFLLVRIVGRRVLLVAGRHCFPLGFETGDLLHVVEQVAVREDC